MSTNNFRKPFDPSLLEQFDKPGKNAVRKYFESLGYLVAYNPNDYTADMIILKKTKDGLYEKIAFAEAGVRSSWNSKDWPENWDLRIEARKAQYLKHGLPCWYCVLNKDFSSMILVTKPLTDFPLIEVSNRYMKNEKNYSIPKTDFEVIDLKDEDLI